MNTHVFVVSVLAFAALSPISANALTVNNKDQLFYKLKVTPNGGPAMNVAIRANGKTNVDCKMGCTLSLSGQADKIDARMPTINIKDGKLVMLPGRGPSSIQTSATKG